MGPNSSKCTDASAGVKNCRDAHVVLLGDSTIDNVVWTGHPFEVPAQLRGLLPQTLVTNFAADGFTSTDLLEGAIPAISFAKRQEVGDPYPDLLAHDGVKTFKPLEILDILTPAPTHAVVSIGGNDVREILGSMQKLPSIMSTFQQNYMAILERLCTVVPKVVLMFQYRPSFHMEHRGYGVYQAMDSLPGPGNSVMKINKLMETIYEPILAEARRRRLPVVDLPRTFDIYDSDLYCCQIEPSAKGGRLIAELLSHVVSNHNFEGPSILYVQNDGHLKSEVNDGAERWKIPHDEGENSEMAATDESNYDEQLRGVDTAAFKQLCQMGFEPQDSVSALQQCGGDNVGAAVSLLTNGGLIR